jgi:hypothetical protein
MSGRRQFPWVLAPVPWSRQTQFVRGFRDGLPLLSWGIAPKDELASRRQLRARGLRPGGQDPVALLYFWSRKGLRLVYTDLFLIERAKPVRPMTPAKWAALDAALAARRVCPECGEDGGDFIRPSVGRCEACQYRTGEWDPADPRHDFITGQPVDTTTPGRLIAA